MHKLDGLHRRITELENAQAKHKQVEKELHRRASMAGLVHDVALRTSGALEPDELFSTIVAAVRDALHCYSVALLLVDGLNDRLTLQAVTGHMAKLVPENLQIAIGEGMVGSAAQSGETQISGDVSRDPRSVRKVDSTAKSEMAVPIKYEERVVGVLDIQSDILDAFGEVTVAAMETLGTQIAISIENAHLYKEARGRAERLAVVNRVAKAVGASLQLDELMGIVYQELTTAFDNDALYLLLYDEENNELDCLFGVEKGKQLPRERIPLGGWSAIIVKDKQPLHIRDFEQERERLRLPEPVMWGDSTFYPSWLGVPMRIGGRVIGVINVMVNRPHAYSDEDERLLVTIADQVAVAIENARLFEETERRVAQLALVNDVGAKVAAVLELERLLGRVVKLVYEGFGYDHVAFLTVDREREELVVKVRMGSLAGVLPEGHRIPFGKGLVGTVARSNKALVVNDVHSEPRYDNPRPDVVNTQSELVVPVRIGNETVGVLDLQSPKLHAFDTSDVAVLETLANQIAVAIENARLYETVSQELTERKRKEGEIRQLSQYLQSVIDNATMWLNVLDEEGNVVIWNKAAEAISGYSRDEVVGYARIWKRLYPPDY